MTLDQISVAAKANVEAQMVAASLLQSKALDSFAQLIDLNLRAARATLEESAATTQQLLAAKDARELLALVAAQAQPAAAKAVAYSRNLASIAGSAQAELAKAAEEQAAARAREATGLVDQFAQTAPPGMEQAVALVKTAMTNASAGYEQINKLAKQANEALEQNFGKVFAQFANGTAGKARK